jgi:DNA repair protein RadB
MGEQRITTGLEILDILLEGGIEKDAITTVFGPAGSGKTNIAMLTALGIARRGKKAIYIDTEGGFSMTRLKQVCPDYKKLIEHILFLNPTSFDEQKKSFEKLKNLISSKSGSKIGIIIVDTLGMLYRLERSTGDEQSHGYHRELGMQVSLLNEICRKYGIPVLVMNQVYADFENSGVRMVGGDIINYGSKCLIELQSLSGGRRRAVIRKHRSIASGKDCYFAIVQEGIAALNTTN